MAFINVESINGKSQALLLELAYACGSPLNENDQYTNKSTARLPRTASSLTVQVPSTERRAYGTAEAFLT